MSENDRDTPTEFALRAANVLRGYATRLQRYHEIYYDADDPDWDVGVGHTMVANMVSDLPVIARFLEEFLLEALE